MAASALGAARTAAATGAAVRTHDVAHPVPGTTLRSAAAAPGRLLPAATWRLATGLRTVRGLGAATGRSLAGARWLRATPTRLLRAGIRSARPAAATTAAA